MAFLNNHGNEISLEEFEKWDEEITNEDFKDWEPAGEVVQGLHKLWDRLDVLFKYTENLDSFLFKGVRLSHLGLDIAHELLSLDHIGLKTLGNDAGNLNT